MQRKRSTLNQSDEGPVPHLGLYLGIWRLKSWEEVTALIRSRGCDTSRHAASRRKLHDIYQKDGSEIAAEGLRRIAHLYKIEASIRGHGPEERLATRQAQSAPLIADFRPWLTHQRSRISIKSRLGEKLGYIHRHWDGLQVFLTDGRVEMDTNPVENTIRAIGKHVSLYTPSLSVCKHWKCVGVSNATRASFSGYGSFDRLRRQVIGTDLIRRTGYKLHSRKDVGFDKVPDHVVCDA